MSTCSYRILAVDDLPDNLFLLQTVLEAEGYIVDVALDGSTALAKIQTNPPDLVLLDMMMPDMNGYDVLQQIRQHQQLAAIPVLLITAHDQANLPQKLTTTFDDFVYKPIDFDELLVKIKKFCAK